MKKRLLAIVLLTVFIFSCTKSGSNTLKPEPETPGDSTGKVADPSELEIGSKVQEFDEVVQGLYESTNRLRIGNPWSDFVPTGFYLLPGDTLKLSVQQLKGNTLPRLLIGTYSRDTTRWDPRSVQLTAGLNTITPDALGGLLWIRFTTTATPSSRVRITIHSGAGRAPVFIKDKTTDWQQQLAKFQTPDALLINDHVYVVWNFSRALSTTAANANFILQTLDKAVNEGENYISGFDGSSPEHALPTHKIAMVESNQKTAWGVASYYRTWFNPGLLDNCMTAAQMIQNGWGGWHELGHMRQQQAWKWSTLGEVTVNIYTLAAERAIKGGGITRLKGSTTTKALNHINSTDPGKDFNAATGTINDPFVRLVMFHQLWLAFGDSFYISLHKQTRVEKPTPSTDAQKMRYFMLKACSISGKDLTSFFRKWGFRVDETVYDEINALRLPPPATDPSTLTDP